MEDLTREMVSVFPHFKDEAKLALGRKLVALGLARSRHSAAQLFLQKESDGAFWAGLEQLLRAFEEANKVHRIPLPAWGHRRAWKELGPSRRRARSLFILFGIPLAVVDLLNNSLPEFCLQSLVDQVAVDETEKMSLRLMMSPAVLGILYGLQFWALKKIVFEYSMVDAGFGSYVAYTVSSFCLWYFGVHWRTQFKRVASLFLFRRAGVDARSAVVAHYHALRQYLGDLKDHGGQGSQSREH